MAALPPPYHLGRQPHLAAVAKFLCPCHTGCGNDRLLTCDINRVIRSSQESGEHLEITHPVGVTLGIAIAIEKDRDFS
jgi:hypothetical protein